MVDFTRIPIIAGYMGRVRQSLREFIDKKANDVQKNQLEEVSRINPKIIPVPNSFLNFLNRYYSSSDLELSLNGMRTEFLEERKTIIEWESKVANMTRGEAIELIDEINSKLASLKKSKWRSTWKEISISLVKGFIGGGPGGVVSTLVDEGLDIITTLNNRRSISFFNDGKIEADKIKNEEELQKHAFGDCLTGTQVSRYQMLCNSLNILTQPV
jgi:hypothetical protein